MDLSDTLRYIMNQLKEDIIESEHFLRRCRERGFDPRRIRSTMTESRILGILEQGENLYKLWYHLSKEKDLNIVVKITKEGRIKIVIVFPCNIDKRERR